MRERHPPSPLPAGVGTRTGADGKIVGMPAAEPRHTGAPAPAGAPRQLLAPVPGRSSGDPFFTVTSCLRTRNSSRSIALPFHGMSG